MEIIVFVDGIEPFTNMNIAFSDGNFIRFLITNINCPTVRSHGTKYLDLSKFGTESDELFVFSQIIGILSGYFVRIRLDSVCLSTKLCFVLK